ncbi:hypothetical protein NW768_010236 [Fusarium equiseti]|uniref:F-box domain-containing protein n=1 Tax=Fusarium equiseti TaxID=61235 RepID=A0ABQ8R197_FUSEQ|nr:hypothetical protein NW768_010236 [Fusarium equiseti]
MKLFTSKGPPKILQLPKELRDSIYLHLDNGDVKSLRATCSAMNRDVPLRPTRVFLSANSLNIKVFRAVADHERLRHSVAEIVWDDARLNTIPDLEDDRFPNQQPGCSSWFCSSPFRPPWFKRPSVNTWYRDHHLKPAFGPFSWQSPCACYKALIRDQEQIIAFNVDAEAFRYGLRRFSSLKRVTITPSTHGTKDNALYRTPMIKAFPVGFYCPIPKAWPDRTRWRNIDALSWIERNPFFDQFQGFYGLNCTAESYRNKWRGYRAATRALAEDGQHHVTELVVGGNDTGSGINCHIFDQACVEYNDLVNLLRRPGFSHLSLDLATGYLEHEEWISYKSGLLRHALAEAKDLESICIRTTTDTRNGTLNNFDLDSAEEMEFCLLTIFPIHEWPRLEHFGLSGFLVGVDDLIEVLDTLPDSLHSVELNYLAFKREEDSYESLLVKMRDTLNWRFRPERQRPKVYIIASANQFIPKHQFVEVQEAACSFLYEDGDNPFEGNGSIIHQGRGGMQRDLFNSQFITPY